MLFLYDVILVFDDVASQIIDGSSSQIKTNSLTFLAESFMLLGKSAHPFGLSAKL